MALALRSINTKAIAAFQWVCPIKETTFENMNYIKVYKCVWLPIGLSRLLSNFALRSYFQNEGLHPIPHVYDACVSFPVDQAVEWAHAAIMNNHGQNCCAGSRTFVQENIYDEFVKKATAAAENRTVGDPFDPTTLQGPQVRRDELCALAHNHNNEYT